MTTATFSRGTYPSTVCMFCAQPGASLWFVKNDSYPIFRCDACRSGFVWPRPRQEEIDAHYQSLSWASGGTAASVIGADNDYYPGVVSIIRRVIGRARQLSKGDAFLDVGAGNGQYAFEAAQQGFAIAACEPNPNLRAIFREMLGFEPDPSLFDTDYTARHRGSSDVVLLSQVLEHIVRPEETVANIYEVLAPGGLAVIGVPHFGSALSCVQGRGDMYIIPPEHLNYFSRAGLTALMKRSGFVLERMDTFTIVPRTGKFRFLWPPIYAGLKLAEPFGLGMVIMGYFRKSPEASSLGQGRS